MSPAVCVAISVRNGRDYLAEAISSVLGQELPDLELRIYDNLSTDGSDEIARGFLGDARVAYLANERDLGYYGSLNRALAETDARYFVPFAADDVMEPANLAAKVSLLDSSEAGFAHSPVRLIDPQGNEIGELGVQQDAREVYRAPEFFLRCAPVNCITCPSVVARVDALRSIGGFDGRVPYCADWLAWMQLALRHDVAMAHQHLVRWRQHENSGTSASLVSASYAIEDPAALRRALADDAFPAAWCELRAPMLAACLTRMATHLERDGHRRAADGPAALGLAVQALALAPAEEALHAFVGGLAGAAGQYRPHLPVELVAAPGEHSASLAEGLGLARSLRTGGLLRSFVVTVPAPLLERSAAAIEDDLTRNGDIDVDLVAAADASPLLRPGMLTAAALGSPEASLAESLGIPVAALAWPDPFAREADPACHQTYRQKAA